MLEELSVLREIVGDLSSVGLWVFIGYILYSLAKTILTFVAALWLVHKIAIMFFDHIKAPFTKAECLEFEDKAHKSEMESQKTKHKYLIMKEKLLSEIDELKEELRDKLKGKRDE